MTFPYTHFGTIIDMAWLFFLSAFALVIETMEALIVVLKLYHIKVYVVWNIGLC